MLLAGEVNRTAGTPLRRAGGWRLEQKQAGKTALCNAITLPPAAVVVKVPELADGAVGGCETPGRSHLTTDCNGEGIPLTQDWEWRSDVCLLPPLRNYYCPKYELCLHAAAVSNSTGFVCADCEHWGDRQSIHPLEGLNALALMATVFDMSFINLVTQIRPQSRQNCELRDGVWRQTAAA
jgi:hypothetical protein